MIANLGPSHVRMSKTPNDNKEGSNVPKVIVKLFCWPDCWVELISYTKKI